MLNTMSEAQLLMLRAAAKRKDRLVTPPANVRAAAVQSLAGKLIDAGWVKEIKARNDAPVWRKDGAGGETYTLRMTTKGLQAAAAMIEAASGQGAPAPLAAAKKGPASASARRAAAVVKEPAAATEVKVDQFSPIQTRAPRATSKLGRVLDMLAADAGATIGELTAATGWLEHTMRAALTGLRRRGYALSRTRKEREGASVYRIVAQAAEAA
jgi:Protein of unknown function (DUF3489)